jgi:hypothetical protein
MAEIHRVILPGTPKKEALTDGDEARQRVPTLRPGIAYIAAFPVALLTTTTTTTTFRCNVGSDSTSISSWLSFLTNTFLFFNFQHR